MKPKLKKSAIIEQKNREIMELKAQLAYRYQYASRDIEKAGTAHLMASGVLLRLASLGGRDIIDPVVIRDGLSEETIEALRKDLSRSYDLAIRLTLGEQK